MKVKCIFLFLIIYSFSANAQQFVDKAYIFDAYGDEEGVELVQSSDNSYFLIGNSNSHAHGEASVIIIKTDSVGNLIFRKTINAIAGALEKSTSATILNDIIYIAGYNQSPNKSYQAMLLLVDVNGKLMRHKHFGGSDFDFFNDIEVGKNNNLILAGYTYSYGNGDADAFAMIANNLGDSITSKTFGGINKDAFNSLCVFDDKIAYAGYSKSYGNGSENIFIQITNYQLDSLNSYVDSSFTDKNSNNILFTNDSCLSISGYIKDSTNTYHATLLVKIDTSGNLIWERAENIIDGKNLVLNSHLQLNDSTYLIAGWRDVYSVGGKDILLGIRDNNGYFAYGIGIGGYQDDVCNSVKINNNGDFVFIGTTKSYNVEQSAIYFAVFDKNLNNPNSLDSVWVGLYDNLVSFDYNFDIFPNPAKETINIKAKAANKHFEYQLINAYGKNVIEGDFLKEAQINIKHLASGIYFLKIKSGNNQGLSKIIIN
jgi:hypothetical protein